MKSIAGIGLTDVQSVYSGPEGKLWELIMGEQIHIGGLVSSRDLTQRAGIAPGSRGVDLCCCTGAGMRFLLRFCQVAQMTGVDATPAVLATGRQRSEAEGFGDRIRFVQAEAIRTGLPAAAADFVWGEDAWCYVADKAALIAEAVRLVRPGGTIAFTDWLEGPTPLSAAESERFLRFMKFPNLQDLGGYQQLLADAGAKVEVAADTGRFAPYVDLYMNMVSQQLTYDALKIIGFNNDMMGAIAAELDFTRQLARAGQLIQGVFVARKGR